MASKAEQSREGHATTDISISKKGRENKVRLKKILEEINKGILEVENGKTSNTKIEKW